MAQPGRDQGEGVKSVALVSGIKGAVSEDRAATHHSRVLMRLLEAIFSLPCRLKDRIELRESDPRATAGVASG